MSVVFVAVGLAVIGGLIAFLALKRIVWAISVAAVVGVLTGLQLIAMASALPIQGPPPVPFVLWAATGGYAWASPDMPNNAPRTYLWEVPPDMLRDLKQGNPLFVEGTEASEEPQANQEEDNDAQTFFRWSKLEPEDAVK